MRKIEAFKQPHLMDNSYMLEGGYMVTSGSGNISLSSENVEDQSGQSEKQVFRFGGALLTTISFATSLALYTICF